MTCTYDETTRFVGHSRRQLDDIEVASFVLISFQFSQYETADRNKIKLVTRLRDASR